MYFKFFSPAGENSQKNLIKSGIKPNQNTQETAVRYEIYLGCNQHSLAINIKCFVC